MEQWWNDDSGKSKKLGKSAVRSYIPRVSAMEQPNLQLNGNIYVHNFESAFVILNIEVKCLALLPGIREVIGSILSSKSGYFDIYCGCQFYRQILVYYTESFTTLGHNCRR
jgi:hypothetical protein